jgi:hypothetical protein
LASEALSDTTTDGTDVILDRLVAGLISNDDEFTIMGTDITRHFVDIFIVLGDTVNDILETIVKGERVFSSKDSVDEQEDGNKRQSEFHFFVE